MATSGKNPPQDHFDALLSDIAAKATRYMSALCEVLETATPEEAAWLRRKLKLATRLRDRAVRNLVSHRKGMRAAEIEAELDAIWRAVLRAEDN
jgi:hypothetical protein